MRDLLWLTVGIIVATLGNRRALRRTRAQIDALVALARMRGITDAAIAGLVTGAMPVGMAPFEVYEALDREAHR